MSMRQSVGAMVLVLAVGFMLRAYHVAERSLWYDEAFAYSITHDFTWSEMIDCLQQDVHPPFYFAGLRIWASVFGDSVYALRGFSILMGELTLVGVYLFTRDIVALSDDNAVERSDDGDSTIIGIGASCLLAVFSSHIWWSQDAKMYSLATALLAYSSWFLVRAMSSRASPSDWCMYAILSICGIYTHNYVLFSVFGQLVFAMALCILRHGVSVKAMIRQRTPWCVCLCAFGIALAYLPWASTVLTQSRRVKADYWIPKATLWTIPCNLDYIIFPQPVLSTSVPRAILVTVAIIALLGVVAWRGSCMGWLVITLISIPIAAATAISYGFAPIVTPRYFLFAIMFLPTAISMMLWRLMAPRFWICIAFLAINCFAVHAQFLQGLHLEGRGARGAVDYWTSQRGEGEALIVSNAAYFFTVKYYTRGIANPKLLLSGEPLPHYIGGPILKSTDGVTPAELDRSEYETVWVIDSSGFGGFHGVRSRPSTSWTQVSASAKEFPEALDSLGVVTVTRYQRR